MSEQYVTAQEAQVIAEAAGKEYVVKSFNGSLERFCGYCGRLIHHPACPKLKP